MNYSLDSGYESSPQSTQYFYSSNSGYESPPQSSTQYFYSENSGHEASPQSSIQNFFPNNQVDYNYQVQVEDNFAQVSLNDTPQTETQYELSACERLANFVNSIPTTSLNNDRIFSSSTKTKKNKPQIVNKEDNVQPCAQISDRSHLYTSSCGQTEFPGSLQQSTTFTTPSEENYAAIRIPANECQINITVDIENPTLNEAIAPENHNNILHQDFQDFQENFESYNSQPEKVQFTISNIPSGVPQDLQDLLDDLAPDGTWENIILERSDYLNIVPSNNEQETRTQQEQQRQESFVTEQSHCSRYPYMPVSHTEARSREFVIGTEINYENPFRSDVILKPPPPYPGKSTKVNEAPLNSSQINNTLPTSNIASEMKYETQSGPPTTPSHLTSSGVEPPHSSQASGIVMGDSPAEVVGVDSLLLAPWAANGPEFLEGGVPDVKQTAGFQDTSWVDSLMLGSTVNVASAQSLMEIKGPLPSFTNYTGHLSINGISGHHYHTIASSGQRSSVPSASPTPSSNQEYYESPVVSSSTPCPQVSQKHQQNHHQQQQQQHPQNQHQPQQQLPQSTQQMEYDIDDIAEIIGSAIADTTVPGNGNGPNSEQTSDTSRDWIDIADWIIPECSPKNQETTSPNSFAPQIYVTTTPTMPAQQHAGSTLQNLLTQNYAPLLQARLQAGNAPGLQNASCGETPSSTSPYPPLSPPNRVSTSCSPDDLLHSSFATPSHPRKRSRSSPGSGQNPNKKNPAVNTAVLPYGAESEVAGNPKKPVHRCHICNRAFLNKSNIKVHLRTHTGEKPFKCDVCSKAFRQKAHLIKHQQIHKRGGRE